ncbi:MAG: hypothetical protein U0575_06865 [Phycisphaerales bacterium]
MARCRLAASAPRRTTSAARIIDLTLGGYFRRLRDERERFVRTGRGALPGKRRAQDGAAQPSIQELLDDPSRIDELFGSTVHRLSMLGTAVGSTAARMAEAV